MSFFPRARPASQLLWVVIHFIVVVYCILNLTDSFGEDGRGLESSATFKIFTKFRK